MVRAAFFGGPCADQIRDIGYPEGRILVPQPSAPPLDQAVLGDDLIFAYVAGDYLPSGELAYYPEAASGRP